MIEKYIFAVNIEKRKRHTFIPYKKPETSYE